MSINSGRPERPNTVLLTAHDMGRFLGYYGRQAHTPVLDEFAADGARFDSAFCPAPHCCPARASVHTGLLPHNNGMFGHVGTHKNWTGWEIYSGMRTLPQYLHDRLVGKLQRDGDPILDGPVGPVEHVFDTQLRTSN